MLKVLITSGGTKVPIDDVRSITNMSKGTFGSRIALQFLKADEKIHVHFLHAKNSLTPFSMSYDPSYSYLQNAKRMYKVDKLFKKCTNRYTETAYVTYADYAYHLESLINEIEPDIIVLAAAVSDYVVVNQVEGKIRSSNELNIELKPAEKLISKIKNINEHKNVLVGFKLLVGSTREELTEAAQNSIIKNDCDLVIANDLKDIRNNNHKLIILEKNASYYRGSYDTSINEYSTIDEFGKRHDKNYLASIVAERSICKWNKNFGKRVSYGKN